MPTTVIAERPTPVSRRVMNSPAGPHTKAFRGENPEYHTVVRISALFRPTRSENQPPVVAPKNMPINVAETMTPIVETDSCQDFMMAGAANEKVLIPPSSEKKTHPRNHMICR